MPQLFIPVLALLVLRCASPEARPATPEPAAVQASERADRSAYAELEVMSDQTPYRELDIPHVPWSFGVSYRGREDGALRHALGS
jgi:hypothetical protein